MDGVFLCLTLTVKGAGIRCVSRDTNINVMFHSEIQVKLTDAQDLFCIC